MSCAICNLRRPRRFCPGVNGEICAICCGTEREITVDCPLDCEYLAQARVHDRPVEIDPADLPNTDIPVTEEFVTENQPLVSAMGAILIHAAEQTAGAVDFDFREALAALIQTYRTLQNGLIYEALPVNPLAASVYRMTQAGLTGYRREKEQLGGSRTKDSAVLGVLAFFQRVELDRNNGRRRSRGFIDALYSLQALDAEAATGAASPSSLILP